MEVLKITEEIRSLAKLYIKEKVVTQKYYGDALHIACATVNQIDVLVSWNFTHIVNFNRILLYNSVNLKQGYRSIQIYSPREVLEQHEE